MRLPLCSSLSLCRIPGLLLCRMSSSRSGQTHKERTEGSSRNKIVSQVTVTRIEELSPRVKGYRLQVAEDSLKFSAGQWIDLYIPGIDTVGGYSITSPPHQRQESGTIDLAIQHSDHPPALWMTTKCQVGDELTMQVGGDFTYASPSPRNLLLIAGGVGINPLFSMLQHHTHLLRHQHSSSSSEYRDSNVITQDGGNVEILFSAKSADELIFKESIDRICSCHDDINVHYFLTKHKDDLITSNHRIGPKDVAKALVQLDRSRLECYVCGPPPMTEDMLKILLTECSVEPQCLHYEKWW